MSAILAIRISSVTSSSTDAPNSCKRASRSLHLTAGIASAYIVRRNLVLTLARAGCIVLNYCLSGNEVKGFLTMAETESFFEDRGNRRIAMNIPVRLIIDPQGTRTEHVVQMLNASEWGARLRTGIRLDSNKIIEVVPRANSSSGVLGRIVWSAELGPSRETETGVNFLAPCGVDFWTD